MLGESGQIEDALNELWIAISIQPKWEAAWVAMAATLISARRTEEALEILERGAVEVIEITWDFAYHLGAARLWCGDTKGALDMFEYALQQKPDHAFAMDLAADCYMKLGDRRKGREYQSSPIISECQERTLVSNGASMVSESRNLQPMKIGGNTHIEPSKGILVHIAEA